MRPLSYNVNNNITKCGTIRNIFCHFCPFLSTKNGPSLRMGRFTKSAGRSSVSGQFNLQVMEEEGEDVALLFDLFAGGLAEAMPGLRL